MTNANPKITNTPVEELSFEHAQSELEAIVEALEDRLTGLVDALALWERGEALHAWCRSRLDHAAERLRKITLSDEEIAAAAAEGARDDFAKSADGDTIF
jgi:exodeoxyribonuclease VII small subunit